MRKSLSLSRASLAAAFLPEQIAAYELAYF
jgi:hypothetical protein